MFDIDDSRAASAERKANKLAGRLNVNNRMLRNRKTINLSTLVFDFNVLTQHINKSNKLRDVIRLAAH